MVFAAFLGCQRTVTGNNAGQGGISSLDVRADGSAAILSRPQENIPARRDVASALDATVSPPPHAPLPPPPESDRSRVDGGAPAWRGFLGGDDATILRRLCDSNVERIERNRGGSTISFRTWFEGGTRGLFKPQQRAEVANFRAELAAYRLSRWLGLHRVPPACGRTMTRARLQTVADSSGDSVFSERVLHELLGREETVPGAMLYWVPGPLENVAGTERWPALLDPAQPLAPGDLELAADLARLILFDFITDNVDRWSGGNILRQHLAHGDPSPMLFMDNGASFSIGTGGLGARPREQADRLARVGRMPQGLIAALRALTVTTVQTAVREDPLGTLLSEPQIAAVITRRDRVIEHVDAMIRARGESAVMLFP